MKSSAGHVIVAGAALLVLAAVSYFLSGLELGALRVPVALAIAAAKVAVVAVVFMEVRRESSTVHVAIATAVVMVVLVIGLTCADVATR